MSLKGSQVRPGFRTSLLDSRMNLYGIMVCLLPQGVISTSAKSLKRAHMGLNGALIAAEMRTFKMLTIIDRSWALIRALTGF